MRRRVVSMFVSLKDGFIAGSSSGARARSSAMRLGGRRGWGGATRLVSLFSLATRLTEASRMRGSACDGYRGFTLCPCGWLKRCTDNSYYVKSGPRLPIVVVVPWAENLRRTHGTTYPFRDLRLSKPVPTPRKVSQASQIFSPIHEGAIFFSEYQMGIDHA